MDLAQLDTTPVANEGVKLELRGPDDAPLRKSDGSPITITVLGKDSDAFVRQSNANANRYLNQKGRAKLSAEALKGEGISLLAKCTVDWDGIMVEGETLDCTYDNAVKLYDRFAFIREQVDEFIGDRSNFSKASPTS